MMALEAVYCKLDAAKVEYSKLLKEAKQKARDRDEKPAPEIQKKAKDPRIRPITWLLTSSPMQLH